MGMTCRLSVLAGVPQRVDAALVALQHSAGAPKHPNPGSSALWPRPDRTGTLGHPDMPEWAMNVTRHRHRGIMAAGFAAIALAVNACGGATDTANTFTVGGSISGLIGNGCVLQNNGGDDLALTAGANAFTFPTRLQNGAPYAITVAQQPRGPNQSCVVTNGTGVVADNVITPRLVCIVDQRTCGGPVDLGSIIADEDSHAASTTGTGNGWFRIRLIENSSTSRYVSARVSLVVPAGINYDLSVYCVACNGDLAGESRAGDGQLEEVLVRWEDRPGPDDSAYLLIRVEYRSGSSPESWTLRVQGNWSVSAATCSL